MELQFATSNILSIHIFIDFGNVVSSGSKHATIICAHTLHKIVERNAKYTQTNKEQKTVCTIEDIHENGIPVKKFRLTEH